MTFQYCSDIHLELLSEFNHNKLLRFIEQRINPSADYLILAGDIGQAHRPNYKFLLSWCSSHFKKTFVVAGNHEYYTTNRHCYTMSEVDQKLKEVCDQFNNVKFLQKKRYEFIDNNIKYIILGCTFWAPIPNQYQGIIAIIMNDYRMIHNDDNFSLKPSDSDKIHQDHKFWLFSELDDIVSKNDNDLIEYSADFESDYELDQSITSQSYSSTKVIVITHHAPSLKLNQKVDLPCGYAADYEHLIGDYVYAWVSGHTHEVHNYKTDSGTLILANCIGYIQQQTGYNNSAIF